MRRYDLLIPLWLMAATVQAGGHFDVDDAFTLDPGQCQYELWGGRFGDEPVTDIHLGPACRVGPVELGFNFDRYSVPGLHGVVLGPQVKWTYWGQGADSRFAAAMSAGVNVDVTHGGYTGGQVLLPVSWRALDSLWIHANVGADWSTVTGERTGRGGLQGEWALNDKWSLMFERFRAFGFWTSRVGARFNVTPLISVDVTAARTSVAGSPRVYVIGLNHEFKAP
ncbi:hypothetical protein QTH90_21975 [Variovorax sp. J2P1-59]|uniref:hypothetical protein n=1 Tax=Variovorax flavidus TaxID=3053501 RepID=UPI002578A9BB|nr:hypothetical protein [Variovorax sp. J2P1-59]MDM0077093.1 hypothetical protein [Variovorax sp. J2P1-59]